MFISILIIISINSNNNSNNNNNNNRSSSSSSSSIDNSNININTDSNNVVYDNVTAISMSQTLEWHKRMCMKDGRACKDIAACYFDAGIE